MSTVEEELNESILIFIKELEEEGFKDKDADLNRRLVYIIDRCSLHSPEMVSCLFRRCVGVCIREVGRFHYYSTMLNIKLTPPKFDLICSNVTRIIEVLTLAVDSPHIPLMHYTSELKNALINVVIVISHNRDIAQKYYL